MRGGWVEGNKITGMAVIFVEVEAQILLQWIQQKQTHLAENAGTAQKKNR